LLTLANLPVAWQSQGPRHDWWLGAVVTTLFERIAKFAYFIPTARRLMRAEALPSTRVEAMASRWMALNHVRTALALIGWLAALRALSLCQDDPDNASHRARAETWRRAAIKVQFYCDREANG
jgi:hypothetical protein